MLRMDSDTIGSAPPKALPHATWSENDASFRVVPPYLQVHKRFDARGRRSRQVWDPITRNCQVASVKASKSCSTCRHSDTPYRAGVAMGPRREPYGHGWTRRFASARYNGEQDAEGQEHPITQEEPGAPESRLCEG